MGLWDLFRKRTGNQHRLTDDDRERAAEINRARFELQRQKFEKEKAILEMEQRKRELQIQRDMAKLEEEIKSYSDGDDDDDEHPDSPEKLLTGLFMSSLLKSTPQGNGGGISSASPLLASPPPLSLSDEQLAEIWLTVPKPYRKIAQKMTDEQINALISSKVGNLDADTRARALNLIRGA